jgi:hypothetical protein
MRATDRPNVLIVYSLMQEMRSTIRDHLYAFRRYSRARCFYVNVAARGLPRWVPRQRWDAVIFHTSFLSAMRWAPKEFADQLRKVAPLKEAGAVRIALPQDEFLHAELLSRFIEDFDVTHVYSVAPESEWPKIYESVDRERVRFSRVLTGYLGEDTVERIDRIVADTSERPTDIGYRAWQGAPWLGRHGMLKRRIGEEFRRASPPHGLATDISMRDEDVLHGDDWFRFLASCKYTIGVEGGATILDRDGAIKERVERYLADHPDAGFDEVEAQCFPGEDGSLALMAISPRHLEACATRTCQVLVEGSYNGILRPGEHYIELRDDLSNLEQVLEAIASDSDRRRITDAAYRDIVASGSYGYDRLVSEVEEAIPPPAEAGARARGMAAKQRLAAIADRASWAKVRLALRPRPRLSTLVVRVLPDPAVAFLRRRIYGRSADGVAAPDSK